MENWNSANSFIFFGKGGEIATNRIEDQEIAVLSLHLLQNCLVYVNTLMLQQVLADKKWFDLMTKEDLRALTPLIYSRHFLLTWLKKQGINDAMIQPYSGHESRQSLEIYSKLAITEAQKEYNGVIGQFPI